MAWQQARPRNASYLWLRCICPYPEKERNGLQPKSQKCIYLGFEHGYKGWCCLDPLIRHTIISHDIIFDESDFPGLSIMENKNEPNIPLPTLFPIEPGVVPNMQPPPDPAPPKANPNIDIPPPPGPIPAPDPLPPDPTNHPNQVPTHPYSTTLPL